SCAVWTPLCISGSFSMSELVVEGISVPLRDSTSLQGLSIK
ncbi:13829_t:CDS:1, partial [Cetraspora pellucida]